VSPLDDVLVLDFSTLLPGPLAGLLLAEAGAEVVKIERPGMGDEMRTYSPRFATTSVNFALLNRGKRSIALDLKDPADRAQLAPLLARADVIIEQFRPGVAARLGIDAASVRAVNPRAVHCSISGYGQDGPYRDRAGHDLNYIAEAGMLGLCAGADGAPVLPPALIADIAGGTYPAVLNILLALRQRDRTGVGSALDIAMADNVLTFLYWAMGNVWVGAGAPRPGGELVTGGSPRYDIYRSSDGRWIAAAPLEDRFWAEVCAMLDLAGELRDDSRDPAATRAAVAAAFAAQPAVHWVAEFAKRDVCCSIVLSTEEALAHPQFVARGLFDRGVLGPDGVRMPALPVPVAPGLRATDTAVAYPELGADAHLLRADAEG
jgi:crotonobetainyl-CoA:carnitine CoA-transferase CaiB-like acyl-CoA transferase